MEERSHAVTRIAEMSMPELLTLRTVTKGKLLRLINYINTAEHSENIDVHEISTRGEDLTSLMQKFDDIQTQIDLDEDDLSQSPHHESERVTMETKYYSTKAAIVRILNKSNPSRNSTTSVGSNAVQIRLPKLELPQFHGDLREWPSFINLFQSAMETTNASALQRLQYLKSVLKGDAASLISSLLITNENYSKAMEILKNRYENKTIVTNFHIKQFMSYPTVNKSNLKQFLVTLQQSLDSLISLNQPVEHWDTLLVYIITQKFDNSLRAAWELNRKETSIPTMKELSDFLKLRATAFELMNSDSNTKPTSKVSHTVTNSNTEINNCILCKANHTLNKCPNFLEMSVDKRINYIKSNYLCFNCLQRYSRDHKCVRGTCKYCHKKHSSLIHTTNPPRKVNITNSTNLAHDTQTYNTSIQNHANQLTTNIPTYTPQHSCIPQATYSSNTSTEDHTQNIHTCLDTYTSPRIQTSTEANIHSLQTSTEANIHNIQSNNIEENKAIKSHSTNSTIKNLNHLQNSNTHIAYSNTQYPHSKDDIICPSTSCISNTNTNKILLSTALIRIQDANGSWHLARALLDSGSEINIVTHRLAVLLKSKLIYSSHIIQGIGDTGKQTQLCINTNIASRVSNYSDNLDFIVMDKITVPLPHNYIENIHTWKIPKKQRTQLADPTFYIPQDIDILIGAQLFYSLLLPNRINLGPNKPQLIESLFGWIVSGKYVQNTTDTHTKDSLHVNLLSVNNSPTTTDDLLVKFWHQEEIKPKEIYTPEQKFCEQLFLDTTVQEKSGHFSVELPIQKDRIHELGESFSTAYRKLLFLESKFQKDPQLYTQYKSFIYEFIQLGHAEFIPNFQQQHDKLHCYLPHIGVLRPESRSTKLRTVVNASSPTSTGVSLNDILYEGPNIYNDILDIILRFRMYKYAFTCDIIKMFRTILVKEEYRPLLRILWRDSKTDPLKCIQLKTVTYGTKCAPYLACRTLKYLAQKYSHIYPDAAKIIDSECYMDDFLSGGDSIAQVLHLCNQLVQLLSIGNFKLHKWCTNSTQITQQLQNTHTNNTATSEQTDSANSYDFSANDVIKTLGIKWLTVTDSLSISIPDCKTFEPTKRNILSAIAQIYDPTGILAPVIIKAKILMQEIWKEKLEWDAVLPQNLYTLWLEFYQNLSSLKDLKIQRYYFSDIPLEISLIGFSDASQKAYGACIYFRATYPNRKPTCTLVLAKTRVSPIKVQSLPRLELNGALLLAKLIDRVHNAFKNKFKINKIYLFTDSQIVLQWIKSPYRKLHTYITHRLMEIIELTNSDTWNYINTKSNPADLLTRGVSPQNLQKCILWWNGPHWLIQEDPISWPSTLPSETNHSEIQAEITTSHAVQSSQSNSDFHEYFTKFSNFNKLTRVIAYVRRFVHNLKNKEKINSHLTTLELHQAHTFIVQTVQQKVFTKELQELKSIKSQNLQSQNSSSINCTHTHSSNLYTFKSSPLRKLNPFLDSDNLIRIGGRIHNSNIPFNHAHPIVLPQKEHITTLIIQQYHLRLLHSGIQSTLSNIRMRYWPINGRNEVKNVIHRCTRCVRYRAQVCEQQMASLPYPRVSLTRPFTHVGVDFSGAIYIRNQMGRNCKYVKGYICLFICLSTKAIHLELVSELTSQAFICALKKLIFRKGFCNFLYSDNASNFKGANNELKELYKMFKDDVSYSNIMDYCSTNSIQWKFTVPLASHMGGLYEAGIKSVKSLLKRYLGNIRLTYEYLYTLLVQIEGILNSRPLCTLTDVPDNEVTCLTPAHFLIGSAITDFPEPNVTEKLENRLCLYEKITQIKQKFWIQFYNNYLSELQPRSKWLIAKSNLNIGDIVILKDEATPPACWPLGKIVKLNKNSKDNLVRSVVIKTAKGEFIRPIHKLILLPCNNVN